FHHLCRVQVIDPRQQRVIIRRPRVKVRKRGEVHFWVTLPPCCQCHETISTVCGGQTHHRFNRIHLHPCRPGSASGVERRPLMRSSTMRSPPPFRPCRD